MSDKVESVLKGLAIGLSLGCLMSAAVVLSVNDYGKGYKQGQIDYAQGQVKYVRDTVEIFREVTP